MLHGTFLEQLDGSRDLAALASANALTLDEMRGLIEQMARLELFDTTGATADELSGDWTNAAPRGDRVAIPPLSVLLVGAGALCLRVTDELARFDDTRLVLLDLEHGRETQPGGGATLPASNATATTAQQLRHLLTRGRHTIRILSTEARSREALTAALRSVLADVQAVICCADQPTALTRTLATLCNESRVPLVVGQLTEEGGRVGPTLVGDRTAHPIGCPVCAECHEADRDLFAAALPSFLATRWPRPAPWRYPHKPADVAVVARLVVLSLCTTIEMARGARPADAQATLVDVDNRTVRVEPVTRHPGCEVCFPAFAPSADSARVDAWSRWQSARLQWPVTSAADPRDMLPLLRARTGTRFGLFDAIPPRPPRERNAVWQFFRERGINPQDNPLANAHARQVLRRESGAERVSMLFSGGFDFEDADRAEALALIEGMERLFALSFCPPERIVQARYSDIAADALDPRIFPLYAEEQYQEPGFPLQRFDPGACIPWVWGMDITAADTPVLVPADLVFGSSSGARIFRANSNGAACHSSLPHAVINGIYETVERDALMVAWLNRLALPRVEFERTDPDPWWLRDTVGRLDFALEHVDITTDLEIPVLLAVLRDHRNPGFFLLNMVSQLDAQTQLQKLYRELAQFLFPCLIDRDHLVRDCTRDPDPNGVVTFPDHLAFHQSEQRNRHAAFLTNASTSRPFAAGVQRALPLDAPAELRLLVGRLAAKSYRTIVVNCTAPLLRDLGLHAVKVLVPGLQPLNCGHQLRPLGGERVLTVAERMGLADRRRHLSELNPWPHPFW